MEISFKSYQSMLDHSFLYAAHQETSKLTFGKAFNTEQIKKELARQLDIRDAMYLNAEWVGICDLRVREIDKLGHIVFVQFYYIDRAYRGKHLINLLIQHSVEWCQQHGYAYLVLRTAHNNQPARQSYERNGFKRFEKLDHGGEVAYCKKID